MPPLAVPGRLAELLEHRAHACRLTPDRALASLDEAAAFLQDRGLLDILTGNDHIGTLLLALLTCLAAE